MGEYVLGTILGVGPKRNVGADHNVGVRAVATFADAEREISNFESQISNLLSHLQCDSLSICVIHLFWCVVFVGRFALLRVITT